MIKLVKERDFFDVRGGGLLGDTAHVEFIGRKNGKLYAILSFESINYRDAHVYEEKTIIELLNPNVRLKSTNKKWNQTYGDMRDDIIKSELKRL